MLSIVSVVEATTITGPIKPLLMLTRHEQAAPRNPPRVRSCITTVRKQAGGASGSNEFLRAAHDAGLPVDVCEEARPFDLGVLREMRRIVAARQPDIVESHDFKSHLMVWLLRRSAFGKLRFRWLAFHHGYTRMSLRVRLYQQFDRLTLRDADHVVTLCKPFVDQLARRGVRRARMSVLSNSIEHRSMPEAATLQGLRTKLGLTTDDLLLLTVGRLSPEKGHDDLFAALRALPERIAGRRVRLLIVGDGGERERLRAAAAPCGDRVVFAGYQENPWSFYHLGDVFVLPSHTEGSPLVLLEAMAAGMGIVACQVGGVPELVEHESTALLVPPAAPQELTAGLRRVLEDGGLRSRLGAAARAASASFGPEAYAERMDAVYRVISSPVPHR